MPVQPDPNTGALLGAMIVPASMLAKNQSRHDARRAYLDPVLHRRPNLHLAVQQTVTRLLLRTEENSTIVAPHFGRRVAVAYGVEVSFEHEIRLITRLTDAQFTTSAEEPRRTVSCNHEVILAAGAIVSPALLQVSGIGPAPILNELNVSVHVNLPGVGFNLQDHAMVGAFYNCMLS
jgi:Choline dehydrogenase and related flavoproteins